MDRKEELKLGEGKQDYNKPLERAELILDIQKWYENKFKDVKTEYLKVSVFDLMADFVLDTRPTPHADVGLSEGEVLQLLIDENNKDNFQPYKLAKAIAKHFNRPMVLPDEDAIYRAIFDNRVLQDDNGMIKLTFRQYQDHLNNLYQAIHDLCIKTGENTTQSVEESKAQEVEYILIALFNRAYEHGVSGGMSEFGETFCVQDAITKLSKTSKGG